MCLNPIATDFSVAEKRALLRALTPWAERLQTAVIAPAMSGVFGGMDRKWDEIHVSGVPISRLNLIKESHMKVAQSLAALIVAGAFAAPVFAAGTASAPAAAPAPAATTTDAASAPKAEAKHEKKHAHKKAHKAAAKSEAKTDAASAPKAAAPAKQ
jgi:hypothetical protein